MKKYRVHVNGTVYEIEVEALNNAAPAAAPVAAAPAPAAPVAAAPVAAAPVAGESVTSPMPGTILSVDIAVGDAVEEGQTLVILEAMKMENEIPCPVKGKVVSINVTKGATVDTGDVLCVIA